MQRVRTEIAKRQEILAADGAPDDPFVQHDDHYGALRLARIARKRAVLLSLRDEQRIDDIVLYQVQTRLASSRFDVRAPNLPNDCRLPN